MEKGIASIQFSVKLGDINFNQEKVKALIEQTAKEYKPDIILLPETWNLGFFPKNVEELAEDYQNSSSYLLIKELAKKYQVNIVAGSIIVKDNGALRNRSLTFNKEGILVHTHDKGHLFSPAGENHRFTKGTKNETFILDEIKAAHIICYDLRFPEYIRKLVLEGTKILFVSAEWPHPRLNHWQVLSRARAIENQVYVITANGCGTGEGLLFCGHSAIIDPWGEALQEAEEKETIIYSKISLSTLNDVRKKIPTFTDRNLILYE